MAWPARSQVPSWNARAEPAMTINVMESVNISSGNHSYRILMSDSTSNTGFRASLHD